MFTASVGVVLLENLTSHKAFDFSLDENSVNLVCHVISTRKSWFIYGCSGHVLAFEEPLTNVTTSMHSFLALALSCLRETETERPCMKDVVQKVHCIREIVDQEEPIKGQYIHIKGAPLAK